MLFRAFMLIGARLSMLIYASVPFMTAIAGFAFLGETMSSRALLGMAITVAGIALAVAGKRSPKQATQDAPSGHAVGIVMAFGGAAGQAAGLLLGKHGAAGIDSFSATQIRVVFGLGGFLLLAILAGQAGTVLGLVKQAATFSMAADAVQVRFLRRGLLVMALGSLLGPFLGVSLGLLSAQLLPTGLASTLMSTVPVLLIPVSALLFREPVSRSEVVGAVLAVAGVAVLAR